MAVSIPLYPAHHVGCRRRVPSTALQMYTCCVVSVLCRVKLRKDAPQKGWHRYLMRLHTIHRVARAGGTYVHAGSGNSYAGDHRGGKMHGTGM